MFLYDMLYDADRCNEKEMHKENQIWVLISITVAFSTKQEKTIAVSYIQQCKFKNEGNAM